MPKNEEFVVLDPSNGLYLTGLNINNTENCIFGNLSNAIIFTSLEKAQLAAGDIGGGTVGTTKPNN